MRDVMGIGGRCFGFWDAYFLMRINSLHTVLESLHLILQKIQGSLFQVCMRWRRIQTTGSQPWRS